MRARGGQVAVYLVLALVAVTFLAMMNVGAFLAVRAKNRAMNAGDYSPMTINMGHTIDAEFLQTNDAVTVSTVDGSVGVKGFVTDAIAGMSRSYDYFYTCGPMVMMKAVCSMAGCPGEASLEERMGCGCGICYGCTCHTASGPKRVCADGPVFKKEDIIW